MPAQQETTLTTVLSDRLLEVPDYQRPYAWTTKQLEDLWEDLDLVGPKGQHYFGTLVLRDVRDDDGEVRTSLDEAGTTLRHSEVVDGQQRVTTCVVLLDRIRRRLAGLAGDGIEGAAAIAESLRRSFGVVVVDNVSVPRLRLGQDLNEYWTSVVLGDEQYVGGALIGGAARLAGAVAFFDARLIELANGVDPTEFVTRLRELQRRVTAGLRVLVYEVASAAEVGVIFETLNERGRPLTELEKTKNYLLYLARQIPDGRTDDLAAFINSRWAGIFGALARSDGGMDDQLLRVHWLATQNADLRSWQGVASIKRAFDRSRYVSASTRIIPSSFRPDEPKAAFDHLYSEVKDYVASLHHCAHFVAEMFDPHAQFVAFGSGRERARRASAALARSGVVALYRPLLCAARLRYPNDGDFYADLADVLDRYSARVFVISQRRANAGQAKLASLAFDLFKKRATPEEVLDAVSVLLWRYASDTQVRAALESETENWYARRGHKYFLYEYELSRMGSGEQLQQFGYFIKKGNEQRTTEHILPQNPDPGAACWWDSFSKEEHVALRHALGNLVLTLDNSQYSNKCFADKRGAPLGAGSTPKACYAQSSFHQERELAAFDTWTPDTIRARQKQLAEWALERWAVSVPGTDVLEPQDAEPEIEAEGAEDEAGVESSA